MIKKISQKYVGTGWKDIRNVSQRARKCKKQREMNNTVADMKNTLDGINSKIIETEQISDLENRLVKITTVE